MAFLKARRQRARDAPVTVRLRSLTTNTLRNMGIIVVLMDYRDRRRSVDDPIAFLLGMVNQPVVPTRPADREIRDRRELTARVDEVVDAGRRVPDAPGGDDLPQFHFPNVPEGERPRHVEIPAPSDQQEPFAKGIAMPCDLLGQVGKQDDVGIYVAEEVVAPDLLRPPEHIAEQRGAELGARHVRHMDEAQSPGHLGRARVIAEEDDFGAGVQPRPAEHRVALDDAGMAGERFRRGEDCKHLLRSSGGR
ncbi:hypothetical protein [Rhodospirillaceae bacterium SYSU D60014]|uniref:hypothetical protein n=1 Tax=Virgifigura deserti TaxID=2268457 RepID=UPI0013C404DA